MFSGESIASLFFFAFLWAQMRRETFEKTKPFCSFLLKQFL